MNFGRLPHISRFEGRIMMAMLLCATVPFLISLVFIPGIIESRLAMSMHSRVETQLEASALFYREFFDAKKREYEARARALARDPELLALSREDPIDSAAVQSFFQLVLHQEEEIWHLGLYRGQAQVELARTATTAEVRTRRTIHAIDAVTRLEVTFGLPARYLSDRKKAAELALVYQASRRLESERARAFYFAYFGILLLAVGIALGVGLFLARSVTRRVSRLATATDRVAKGDMSFQVPGGSGRDEIARLTRDFNRMISEVSEARDRIVYLEKVSGWQDLARRLAHEIKNPLTPIRLAVQELRKRAHSGDPAVDRLMVEVTEVVDEEVEALTRLVDEFSQFARLPAVTPTRVRLGPFLASFARAYEKYREDVNLKVSLPHESADAPIDRVLLRRVLVNLVDNAVEAAPDQPVVHVRGEVDFGSGRTFIHVEDAGPGVPDELAARIFEPYFTTKEEGTGLGLAIVKKIVLQHGGSISHRVSPRGGAAFVLSLPPVPDSLQQDAGDEEDEEGLSR